MDGDFSLLQRLVAALADALTPEDVIAAVAKESLAPLGACAGFVALTSEDGVDLEIRRALGPEEASLPPCRFPLSAGVPTAEAVRELRSVYLESPADRERRYPDWRAGRWSGYGAWAAVPLMQRERALGAMLLCFPAPRAFARAAVELIETVAALCGQALHRAVLLHAAHEADRKKDEFLAILGHELRNPLAPIQTAIELLKLRGAAERELAGPIEVMGRQVRHLARLVDDLMDISRITRGKITLEKETLDARTVIARAVEMAAPLFDEKAQHLRVELPPEPVPIHADAVRLGQVVANLCTNAAKYTPPGGHIEVRLGGFADRVEIAVRDDGAGLSPEMLPRVFEPFVQGPRTLDRAGGGLGVGLTLVRSLVELHGGSVTARSEGPGTGAEFIVRLPPPGPEPHRATVLTPPSATSGKRVLLVDDNADAADLVGEILGELGYQVVVAHDAVGALKQAETLRPDVALLDLGLPVMDGYELAARLRASSRPPRLVAITGYGQDADRRRSREAGFAAHLTKPVSVKQIVAAIEDHS